ncbi:MAG: hypothetical protein JNM68_01220 [Dinghuibacter sp.]|nr:hypothetical protein [Dinghuibacter sp.]
MNRILYLLTALVLVFSSCQRELNFENVGGGSSGGGGTVPDTAYYIKFKLNGTAFDYRSGIIAVKASLPAPLNVKTINVSGRAGTALQPLLAVDVRSATDIVVNQTYTEAIVNGTFSSLLYRDAGGENYSSALTLTGSGFECRFSEITATYVKGTFKGKVQTLAGSSADITEGSFFAKLP